MSVKHPIISVTGSSGAGTTSVKQTFEMIFWRENINAVFTEGDAFHRFDREDMKKQMADQSENGNSHFSHFNRNWDTINYRCCINIMVVEFRK